MTNTDWNMEFDMATMAKNVPAMKWAIKNGANVDFTGRFFPVIEAAGFNDLEFIDFLLEKGANIEQGNISSDVLNHRALIVAFFSDSTRAFGHLLSKGANPDCQFRGQSLLMEAARNNTFDDFGKDGRLERVKLLLDAGADLDFTDHEGKNATLLAIENGHYDIAAAIEQERLSRANATTTEQPKPAGSLKQNGLEVSYPKGEARA